MNESTHLWDEDEEGDNRTWLVVFCDLISLCLTFFILTFSMSQLDHTKWEVMTGGNNTQFGIPEKSKGEIESFGDSENQMPKKFEEEAQGLSYLKRIISEQIAKKEALKEVQIIAKADRLVLTLPSDTLFEPGKAVLKEQSYEQLNLVASIIKNLRNRIDVIGHTDPTDISTEEFPSNWELSIARAKTVAEFLKSGGFNEPVNIFGLADSRINEVADLPNEQERNKLARRVEIEIREQSLGAGFPDVR